MSCRACVLVRMWQSVHGMHAGPQVKVTTVEEGGTRREGLGEGSTVTWGAAPDRGQQEALATSTWCGRHSQGHRGHGLEARGLCSARWLLSCSDGVDAEGTWTAERQHEEGLGSVHFRGAAMGTLYGMKGPGETAGPTAGPGRLGTPH